MTSAFASRYELGPILRSTPLAFVHRVHDRQLDRDVALTMLRPDLLRDAAAVGLFAATLSVAAELAHPHIAGIYDAGVDDIDGQPARWAVGEYTSSLTIAQFAASAELSVEAWTNLLPNLAEQLANAMQFAHANGVVHGALAPDAVLLQDADTLAPRVKLTGFGPQAGDLAVLSDPELTVAMWRRFTDQLSDPSPEQQNGMAPTRRSDIYGFGRVLSALLAPVMRMLGDAGSPSSTELPSQTASPRSTELPGVTVDPIEELHLVAAQAMSERPIDRQHSFFVVLEQLRWIRVARVLEERSEDAPHTLVLPRLPDANPQPRTEEIRVILRQPLPLPPRKRGHNSGAWLFAILAAATVVILVGAFWLPTLGTATADAGPVTIPTVTGKDIGQASTVLGRIGLTVSGQRSQPDAIVPVGMVLGTDPAAGAQLNPASAVTLLVSTGPELGTIPQMVGATLAASQEVLAKAGLVAGSIRYRDGITVGGIVLKSTPDFGGKLAAGSQVDLVVSSGNQHVPQGLAGQSAEAAAVALAAAGFTVQSITVSGEDVAPGVVLEVNPAAGSIQPLGSIVTITASLREQQRAPTPSDSTSPYPSPTPDG